MSDQPAIPGSGGKWLRFALAAFPAGLVLLGAASFWFYFEKKDREMERTFRHAEALRRELNVADLARDLRILQDTASLATAERCATIATFLESSLGPDNMGYEAQVGAVKSGGADRFCVSVELPGQRQRLSVVLVIAAYGAGADLGNEAASLAAFMGLAREFTGRPRVKTVRFAALDLSGPPESWPELLELATARGAARGERVARVIALGGAAADLLVKRGPDGPPSVTHTDLKADPGALMEAARRIAVEIAAEADKL